MDPISVHFCSASDLVFCSFFQVCCSLYHFPFKASNVRSDRTRDVSNLIYTDAVYDLLAICQIRNGVSPSCTI